MENSKDHEDFFAHLDRVIAGIMWESAQKAFNEAFGTPGECQERIRVAGGCQCLNWAESKTGE